MISTVQLLRTQTEARGLDHSLILKITLSSESNWQPETPSTSDACLTPDKYRFLTPEPDEIKVKLKNLTHFVSQRRKIKPLILFLLKPVIVLTR